MIYRQSMIDKAALILLLCLINDIAFSQADTNKKIDREYNSQFQISLMPMLYQNLKVEAEKGTQYLKSNPTLSGNFSIAYNQHIRNGFYINLGAGIGVVPFNINYDLESKPSLFLENQVEVVRLSNKFNFYSQWVYNIPLSVQKSFYHKKRLLNVGIGIDYKIINDYSFTGVEGAQYVQDLSSPYNDVDLFYIDIPYSGTENIFSLFLQMGYKLKVKNKNTVDFQLIMDYVPKNISKGRYEFYQLIEEHEGFIEQRISNIGIKISYCIGT